MRDASPTEQPMQLLFSLILLVATGQNAAITAVGDGGDASDFRTASIERWANSVLAQPLSDRTAALFGSSSNRAVHFIGNRQDGNLFQNTTSNQKLPVRFAKAGRAITPAPHWRGSDLRDPTRLSAKAKFFSSRISQNRFFPRTEMNDTLRAAVCWPGFVAHNGADQLCLIERISREDLLAGFQLFAVDFCHFRIPRPDQRPACLPFVSSRLTASEYID